MLLLEMVVMVVVLGVVLFVGGGYQICHVASGSYLELQLGVQFETEVMQLLLQAMQRISITWNSSGYILKRYHSNAMQPNFDWNPLNQAVPARVGGYRGGGGKSSILTLWANFGYPLPPPSQFISVYSPIFTSKFRGNDGSVPIW